MLKKKITPTECRSVASVRTAHSLIDSVQQEQWRHLVATLRTAGVMSNSVHSGNYTQEKLPLFFVL